ncbi:hypothetical protein PR048_002306 [Dryococelus australis]|uniref:Peptidase A2 domain-containing protein n=1 Tax=Dryococelus australis TaxID=614101 RepID=A0ABQ9IJS7_9NEOP|nr:hypothetical protein PR048_002306 [Dryococelus australis]
MGAVGSLPPSKSMTAFLSLACHLDTVMPASQSRTTRVLSQDFRYLQTVHKLIHKMTPTGVRTSWILRMYKETLQNNLTDAGVSFKPDDSIETLCQQMLNLVRKGDLVIANLTMPVLVDSGASATIIRQDTVNKIMRDALLGIVQLKWGESVVFSLADGGLITQHAPNTKAGSAVDVVFVYETLHHVDIRRLDVPTAVARLQTSALGAAIKLDAIKEDIRKADIPKEGWRDRALWGRLVGEAMDRLRSMTPLHGSAAQSTASLVTSLGWYVRCRKPNICAGAIIKLLDHVRGFLGDHDNRRIGVTTHYGWHDGAVNDAEPINTMHTELGIHHRPMISSGPHSARAHMVECGYSVIHDAALPEGGHVEFRPRTLANNGHVQVESQFLERLRLSEPRHQPMTFSQNSPLRSLRDVVLVVVTNTEVFDQWNIQWFQKFMWANTRQLQKLRRVDATSTQKNSTPYARGGTGSTNTRVTIAFVRTRRFGRSCRAAFRNAVLVLWRSPFLVVSRTSETPSCSPAFGSRSSNPNSR